MLRLPNKKNPNSSPNIINSKQNQLKSIEQILINPTHHPSYYHQFKNSSIIGQYVKDTMLKMLKIKKIDAVEDKEYVINKNIYGQRYINAQRMYKSQGSKNSNYNQQDNQQSHQLKSSIKIDQNTNKQYGKFSLIKGSKAHKNGNPTRISLNKASFRNTNNKANIAKYLIKNGIVQLINPNSQGFKYFIKQSSVQQLKPNNLFSNHNFLLQPCQSKPYHLQKRPYTAAEDQPNLTNTKKQTSRYSNVKSNNHRCIENILGSNYAIHKSGYLSSEKNKGLNVHQNCFNYLQQIRINRRKSQAIKRQKITKQNQEQMIQPWQVQEKEFHGNN